MESRNQRKRGGTENRRASTIKINTMNKIFIGIIILVLIAVVFVTYFIFFKHDPVKDGKNVAIAFCDCDKDRTEQQINTYKDFIANYDSYKIKSRKFAQSMLDSAINSINDKAQKCKDKSLSNYIKYKEIYIAEKEQIDKYEYAFNAQQQLCKDEKQTSVNEFYLQVQNLLTQTLSYQDIINFQKSTIDNVTEFFTHEDWTQNKGEVYSLNTYGENSKYFLNYNFNYMSNGYDLWNMPYVMYKWGNDSNEEVQYLQKAGHDNVFIYYTNNVHFNELENEVKKHLNHYATKNENKSRESFYRRDNIEIIFYHDTWQSVNGRETTEHSTFQIRVLNYIDMTKIKAELCLKCKGTGKIGPNDNHEYVICPACNGTGKKKYN